MVFTCAYGVCEKKTVETALWYIIIKERVNKVRGMIPSQKNIHKIVHKMMCHSLIGILCDSFSLFSLIQPLSFWHIILWLVLCICFCVRNISLKVISCIQIDFYFVPSYIFRFKEAKCKNNTKKKLSIRDTAKPHKHVMSEEIEVEEYSLKPTNEELNRNWMPEDIN